MTKKELEEKVEELQEFKKMVLTIVGSTEISIITDIESLKKRSDIIESIKLILSVKNENEIILKLMLLQSQLLQSQQH